MKCWVPAIIASAETDGKFTVKYGKHFEKLMLQSVLLNHANTWKHKPTFFCERHIWGIVLKPEIANKLTNGCTKTEMQTI
jgi:hypothetical protein